MLLTYLNRTQNMQKKLYKAQEKAKKAKKRIWSVDGYVTEEGFNMSVWLNKAS